MVQELQEIGVCFPEFESSPHATAAQEDVRAEDHHHIAQSQKQHIYLPEWLATAEDDRSTKV